MKFNQLWPLIRQTASAFIDDRAPSMGAALAYYTVFSMAPLLLIAIAVAGFVFGADAARGEIVSQLRSLMGEQGAQIVQTLLESARRPEDGITATAIGALLLFVGATTVFAELQASLDVIWRASVIAKPSGLWSVLRTRIVSFGVVLGIGFLLLVSLVLDAVLAALGKWWAPYFGAWQVFASILNVLMGFALVMVMFAMIYKLMPRAHIRWHDVWIGAAATAVLFTVGKILIGIYIGTSGVASSFGAAGSMVVLLLWVYYSAQIFLLGAEFTWVYANTLGSRRPGETVAPTRARPHLVNAR